MYKKLVSSLLTILFLQIGYSQNLGDEKAFNQDESYSQGKTKNFKVLQLENGMKVYLNEDHNKSNVLGAVVVKGGSKYDPKDATGIAHYLEHMLFKGTNKIGTVNYKEEKIWLDSIAFMYSMLPYAKGDTAYRARILRKINYYSQKASKFAVPGEFDNLISEIGGTGLNAYTDFEKIVYLNYFPKENINYWLDLYYERFANAVFRLFQTELETVYEEKNMSQDNMFYQVYETVYKNFYPNSIYGKQTVLGSVEHLKNPSLYQMMTYYKSHYVSNNMALVLIGDFNIDEVIEEIERTFGKYRNGEKQQLPIETEKPFSGRTEVIEHLTPIPVGILGYRGTSTFNIDRPAIDLMVSMLMNDNKTGFLDSLNKNNKLMFSMAFPDYHSDLGGIFIAYAPKFPFKGLKEGERMILSQIDRLKKGDFSDDYLEAIKNSMRKSFEMDMESSSTRLRLIAESFVSNVAWDDAKRYSNFIAELNKKDIMRIAQKYFTENYLAFYSKTGFPKATKLAKPNFEPANPDKKNTSEYARDFEERFESNVKPKFLLNKVDYIYEPLATNINYYYSHNPYNQIFTYRINIYVGDEEIPGLSLAADYLNHVGTKNVSFSNFQKQLQLLGTEINFKANKSYFTITMTGFDNNFDKSLGILKVFLNNPAEDDKVIKQFVSERKINNRFLMRDAAIKSSVLTNYAMYGTESPYLKRLSLKEIKKLKSKDLVALIQKALRYKSDYSYSGTIPSEEVKELIKLKQNIPSNAIWKNSPVIRPLQELQNYSLLFLNDKKAVQSQIKIVVPSRALWKENRLGTKPFNTYFGNGLNSLVFREIREYRSLAYSAWATFKNPYKFTSPGYLYCSTSTQADKTKETLEVFSNLIDSMPEDPMRLNIIKNSLLNSINSTNPDFRNISLTISQWKLMGFDDDPRRDYFDYYQNLKWGNIQEFYLSNVSGRYRWITIVGNKDKFNPQTLLKFSDYQEVKLKSIFTK